MTASVAMLDTAQARSRAIRALLAAPLLDRRAGDRFTLVVAHTTWLQRWFDDKCGWLLLVDARRGFARLRKVPARPQSTRGLRTARTTPRPFTPRRYSLLAVIAAVLSDTARPQISLQDLDARVRAATADTDGLAAYDPSRTAERTALVDAATALVSLGVLAVVDTRGDYVAAGTGDVLYDIDDRRLGHLISAPRPPALATSLAHLLHEDRYGPWTDPARPADDAPTDGADGTDGTDGTDATDATSAANAATAADRFGLRSLARVRALASSGAPGVSEEQQRRRIRHRLMRMLLDDPVLYLDRLTGDERTYLQQTIGSMSGWIAEAGLVLERRDEGWAAIDPDDTATDIRFPEGNDLPKFAALLLLAKLQPATVPAGPVRHPRVAAEAVLADRLRVNPTWARAFQDDGGAARLADAALDLLTRMDLAAVDATGITLLPAAGRYRPTVTDTTAGAPTDGTHGPGAGVAGQATLLDPDPAEEAR